MQVRAITRNTLLIHSLVSTSPIKGAPSTSPLFKNIFIIKAIIEGASAVFFQGVSHFTIIKQLMYPNNTLINKS